MEAKAKEKARELVEKFIHLVHIGGDSFLSQTERELVNAKECALIAVDELINSFTNTCCESYNSRYWNEVKQEINKL